MRIIRSLSLILALFGSANAFASEPLKPVILPKIETVDVDPALWVVKDKDTTIYLFGTVHILKPGLGWFDDGVKKAFDRSDELVVEMIEPPAAQAQMIYTKYMLDQSGVPLSQKLPEKDRDAFKALMAKLNILKEAYEPLDPWAVAVTLQVTSLVANNYDPNSGVDSQLVSAAKAAGKPIKEIETFEWQLALFDTLPQESQVRFLQESITGFDELGKGMDQLIAVWSKPDPDALAKLMNEGLSDPALNKALLTDRNANWAKWIDNRMDKPGVVFMAVGAGHLAGKGSVQDMLRQYKLKARRVKY
jgi:uncharacterized protein